jgi:polygalacturonase
MRKSLVINPYIKMKKIILLALLISAIIRSVGAKEFNILEYGAVTGQLSTQAVQKAVDACYDAGGGTVMVPAGLYITGAIILKSNVNLYLEQGAELRSSENMDDFKVGTGRYGMIFCQDATNISITGKGTINAMGSSFYEADKNHTNSSSLGGIKEYD